MSGLCSWLFFVVLTTVVLLAHKAAWEKAGVLHRDISSGNILITEDGRGLLNDWDMCKYKGEGANPQSPAFRSVRFPEHTCYHFVYLVNFQGTWPFMSALLLRCPEKPHQVSDDVESFVHVINWLTLRYQVISAPETIDHSLKMYDDYRRTEAGFDIGGIVKLVFLREGKTGFQTDQVLPLGLRAIVQAMEKMCKEKEISIFSRLSIAAIYNIFYVTLWVVSGS